MNWFIALLAFPLCFGSSLNGTNSRPLSGVTLVVGFVPKELGILDFHGRDSRTSLLANSGIFEEDFTRVIQSIRLQNPEFAVEVQSFYDDVSLKLNQLPTAPKEFMTKFFADAIKLAKIEEFDFITAHDLFKLTVNWMIRAIFEVMRMESSDKAAIENAFPTIKNYFADANVKKFLEDNKDDWHSGRVVERGFACDWQPQCLDACKIKKLN